MPQAISISEALQQGVALLRQAGVGEPRLTAEVLLGAILGCDRAFLYAHGDEDLADGQAVRFEADLAARCSGTPTQYVTGVQEFYGLAFQVTPDVLIPRPETELLVEQALARACPGDWILDIGTGSGAIATAVKKQLPQAKVFASDVSRAALSVAAENARRHAAQVPMVQADLAVGFRTQAFQLILCNPPYVSSSERGSLQREVRDHEPPEALFGGEDGLDAYRRLSVMANDLLRPGGWLLMEVGYNTSAAIIPLFEGGRWTPPRLFRDLAGWERVFAVQKTTAGA